MFNDLKLAHSLYDIDEVYLDDFKKEILSLNEYSTVLEHIYIYSKIDNYAIVLNHWLFFHETEWDIHFNADKIMLNAANYFILEQLRKNKVFTSFFETIQQDEKQLIKFAFHLAEQLILWVYEVLSVDESTKVIIENKQDKLYFDYSHSHSNSLLQVHIKSVEQQQIRRQLSYAIQSNEFFSNRIKTAIEHTIRSKTY